MSKPKINTDIEEYGFVMENHNRIGLEYFTVQHHSYSQTYDVVIDDAKEGGWELDKSHDGSYTAVWTEKAEVQAFIDALCEGEDGWSHTVWSIRECEIQDYEEDED